MAGGSESRASFLFIFWCLMLFPQVSGHNCPTHKSGQPKKDFLSVFDQSYETYEDCETECGYAASRINAACQVVQGNVCSLEATANVANTLAKWFTLGLADFGSDGAACQFNSGICDGEAARSTYGQIDCEKLCGKKYATKFKLTQTNINATREILVENIEAAKGSIIQSTEEIVNRILEQLGDSTDRITESIDELSSHLKNTSLETLKMLSAIDTTLTSLGDELGYNTQVLLYGDVFKTLDAVEERYKRLEYDQDTGLLIKNFDSEQYRAAVIDPLDGMLIGINGLMNMLVRGRGKNWAKEESIYDGYKEQFCNNRWFEYFSLRLTKALFHYRNGRAMSGAPLPNTNSPAEEHLQHASHYSTSCFCSQESLPKVANGEVTCNQSSSHYPPGYTCQVKCLFEQKQTECYAGAWTAVSCGPEGLLISGGYSHRSWGHLTDVEVWAPSTGQHCTLTSLPTWRRGHSQEGIKLCGGSGDYGSSENTKISCLTLTAEGSWENTTTLIQEREDHVSWASPSGTILIGGWYSNRTSEKIDESGTSSYSFDLEYDTREACAINLGSSLLLTGGSPSSTTVSEYGEAGFIRYLPDLNQGRRLHGCSYYEDGEGRKTYMVAGGIDSSGDSLSSTEVLLETASAWSLTGELPSPRYGLRGAKIDNKIVMTGGEYKDEPYYSGEGGWSTFYTHYDEILQFDPLTEEWSPAHRMLKKRSYHAVSVISNFESLC